MTDPRIEGPTPEVEKTEGSASLPGARKGYGKLPTGPVPTDATMAGAGPAADPGEFVPHEWAPESADDGRLAPWALFAAIVALATSMFVGWGIPVAIVAVIAAIMSLRRPVENRAIAVWALVLGLCATLFSAGWLIWATMQFEKLG
ncbi:hypothetical protein [Microbacterium sp. H1-D42]|uniref:hypothetical protein n=1 Tax=Microbacterium sp. H1-D42 TaxID=2925844 RepID=UPI001F531BA9|nr:hypothetical protein [Microbacterium sp. H1-D42]UNK70084.1 hypothetical protein MNR00_13055 [Microbacterium sp. H1-D42]